jgi:hypothetical protein
MNEDLHFEDVNDDIDETEENEPDPIRDAFDDAIAQDKTEDEVMLEMIGAGASFKNVKSLYTSYLIEEGMLDSRAEKAEIINTTLEGIDLSTEDGFNSAVAALEESLKGVNSKSAAASVRQYAKKNELEFFKKPKGAGVGRSGITNDYYTWLKGSVPVTDKDVAEWVDAFGTDNTKRHLSHYQGVAKLCSDIATGNVEVAA